MQLATGRGAATRGEEATDWTPRRFWPRSRPSPSENSRRYQNRGSLALLRSSLDGTVPRSAVGRWRTVVAMLVFEVLQLALYSDAASFRLCLWLQVAVSTAMLYLILKISLPLPLSCSGASLLPLSIMNRLLNYIITTSVHYKIRKYRTLFIVNKEFLN